MTLEIAATLEAREAVIGQGLASFLRVGDALIGIRDDRQYREAGFETFEAYCRDKWHLTHRHVNRMIEAANVVAEIQSVTGPMGPVPASERQARELSGLKPEVAAEVMRQAHEQADGKVTATAIRDARKEIAPKPQPAVSNLISSADLTALNTPARPVPDIGATCSMPAPPPRDNDTIVDQSPRDPNAAMEAYVDADPEVRRARFAKQFADAMGRIVAVLQFNPEAVAAVMDSDDWDTVEDEFDAIARFWTALKSHRTQGLRLVGGTNV